jgi:hypothetical protein
MFLPNNQFEFFHYSKYENELNYNFNCYHFISKNINVVLMV